MNSLREELDFEVLGYKVRLKPDSDSDRNSAVTAVEYVQKEAERIWHKSPQLNQGQVAILVALQMAMENQALSNEYRNNIQKLQSTAKDALQFIEDVSPSAL